MTYYVMGDDTKLFDFFQVEGGLGWHQFTFIMFPSDVALPLVSTATLDTVGERLFRVGQRNVIRLYSLLAPALRRQWFAYNQKACQPKYRLSVTWETFDAVLMPPLIALDLACRMAPRKTFSMLFGKVITQEQEEAIQARGHVPNYHDGVHTYRKYLCYGCDTMALLRNAPTYRGIFRAYRSGWQQPKDKLSKVCRLLLASGHVALADRLTMARLCKSWRTALYTGYGLRARLESTYHRDPKTNAILHAAVTSKKLVYQTHLVADVSK